LFFIRGLIVLKRRYQVYVGDLNAELLECMLVLHNVVALHAADLATQVATAAVLELLPVLQHRLNAYNAFPLYHAVLPIAFNNGPVPVKQLDGKVIVVFNGNAVSKQKLLIYRVAVFFLVEVFNADPYSLG
jgi:hypothetical protein